jgi:hypothetical protein
MELHHRRREEEPLTPFRLTGREEEDGSPFNQKKQQQQEDHQSTRAVGSVASEESLLLMNSTGRNLLNNRLEILLESGSCCTRKLELRLISFRSAKGLLIPLPTSTTSATARSMDKQQVPLQHHSIWGTTNLDSRLIDREGSDFIPLHLQLQPPKRHSEEEHHHQPPDAACVL